MEIPTVIVCICWSLLTCKKSNSSLWITLGTSDHFHLKWLKVLLLLVPYHMQKPNFLTQLILEVKLTHYLLSFWECLVVPEHTHLKQPTNIYCFFGPLVISKNSSSYLKFFVRHCGLMNPVFWFVLRFFGPLKNQIFANILFFQKVKKKRWYFAVKYFFG